MLLSHLKSISQYLLNCYLFSYLFVISLTNSYHPKLQSIEVMVYCEMERNLKEAVLACLS
jgi:hypothetical protein